MGTEAYEYPELQAANSVLRKIGIDPSSRIDQSDQDFEYTACDLSELEAYAELYLKSDTSAQEKRVLGCFLLQTLDDHLASTKTIHPKQESIFELLFADIHIHETELEYWSKCGDSPEEEWYIAPYIRGWSEPNQLSGDA